MTPLILRSCDLDIIDALRPQIIDTPKKSDDKLFRPKVCVAQVKEILRKVIRSNLFDKNTDRQYVVFAKKSLGTNISNIRILLLYVF